MSSSCNCRIKNSLRSSHGQNLNGKTNTWFKLSCNQPFLPHFEFLFECHYGVTFDVTTSLQPQLIQRLEGKFLESFLQLLELKCVAVEEEQLYLREGEGGGGSKTKIEPCFNMLELFDIITLQLALFM